MDCRALEQEELQALLDRREEIEHEWDNLLRERREYEMRIRSLEQREKQFNLKWDMLIRETQQLASDKEAFERKKDFYARVARDEAKTELRAQREDNIVHGEMFFCGVSTPSALKKRYKDLIKIYHPDSESGDNETVQEINREYSNLKEMLS